MRRSLLLGLAVLSAGSVVPVVASEPVEHEPITTIALIDTGINPYHPTFRDPSPLGLQHPSTYLPGYPKTATALPLTLDAPTLDAALEADADIWASVAMGEIYWVPGTRIAGLVAFSASGGKSCDNGMPNVPPAGGVLRNSGCPERRLLDDAGHGTMTASRAAGIGTSLSPTSRIVMIEGLGDEGVRWAASTGWIDVQSNSWGSLAPGIGSRRTIETAAQRHLVVFASGNGTAFSGAAPTPTHTHSTRGLGAIQVGAHDNGNVSAWSDAPAHLVADGFGGLTAPHDSLDPVAPRPISCCTSAAAPYAAGAAARILRDARLALGDVTPGMTAGTPAIAAQGTPVLGSPILGDGIFTLDEWKRVLLTTADARPDHGPHDGFRNFLGGPDAPRFPEHGPGENPFCLLCTTMPVAWRDVPAEVPAYLSIGYGSVDARTVDAARAVLLGSAPLPARPDEDAFFAVDDRIGTVRL